jgi:hypothetical protein
MKRPGRSRRPAALTTQAVAVIIVTLTSGCALTPPKPWEKDLLARPAMALDADPLDRRFTQHIYTSKENSSGGSGVGGGGCGCN